MSIFQGYGTDLAFLHLNALLPRSRFGPAACGKELDLNIISICLGIAILRMMGVVDVGCKGRRKCIGKSPRNTSKQRESRGFAQPFGH